MKPNLKEVEKPSIVEKVWYWQGFKCKVMFVRQSHRCGYVQVPKGHLAYGVDYDKIDVNVHGGLTYSEYSKDKKGYWLGFDCAHLGDKTLGLDFDGHFWTLEETIEETKKLAEQLHTLKKSSLLGYEITEFLRKTSLIELKQLKSEIDRITV